MKRLVIVLLFLGLLAADVFADERAPVTPSAKDKCPVCGMFVKKYPDWVSQIVFKDGSYVVFDGAKDLFKYYLDIKRYNPARRPSDIGSIFVTDYYELRPTDAFKAEYVIGSDVLGPMGHELIPFARTEDAKGFMKDHKGRGILKFNEVTPDRLRGLD